MTIWKRDETYNIVNAFRRADSAGIIGRWKDDVAAWAQANPTDPNAAAVLAWLPLWQPRPFYTASELAPMWPALAIAIDYTSEWPRVLKSARRLEFELDFHKLPRLPDPWRDYFICERIRFWQDASTHEIEREIEHAFG